MLILISILSLAIGALIGYLYEHNKVASLTAQVSMLEQNASDQQQRHEREKAELEQHSRELLDRTMLQIQTTTNEMLKQRQREFTQSSNESIGQIVTPLRETIDRMKRAMEDNTVRQTAMSSEMKANIENMMRTSQAAKESADELTRVFKYGSKVQGDWGETVLDELLQSQGLTPGIHYDTQSSIRDAQGNTVRTEEGSVMRPDVIMHLDQQRELIIDSKVSLTAFMDYANAQNEADRQRYLKAHVDSIQKHVKELAAKNYSAYIKPPKVRMDYVIMFVPHSGALWTALQAQPDLWRKAMDRNVFIADEQTLFAALSIIRLTWTQIAQVENQKEVFRLVDEMIDRVGQFMKSYKRIGTSLNAALDAYGQGEKKLQPGGQSILTTGKLRKIGGNDSKKNPVDRFLDVDNIEPLPLPEAPTSEE